jgi:hypothetical protein
VIALAVGHADTVGVVLEGGGFPPPPLLPPHAAMVRLKRIDNPIETLRLAFIMVQCSRLRMRNSLFSDEV